jgi:1-acyl-sn-glycerol-3-phosphate acyltransferase
MIFLRSILFNVAFYFNLVFLMLVGLPCLLRDRHAVHALARLWARNSLWLLDKICGAKIEFRGLEHMPKGGCLIAAKHQSFLETFALTLVTADFTFVLKRELMRIPFFGWYLSRAEQIGIDRSKGGSALAQIIRQGRDALAEGRQIFIFPEGTRRPPGAAPAYKAGVAQIYAQTGAVCLPVALNTGLVWPRRSFVRRPGRVTIEFLEPIAPGLDKKTFMDLLQKSIETASTRLLAEAQQRDPSLTQVKPSDLDQAPS